MKILSLLNVCLVLLAISVYGQKKTEPLYTESFNRQNCHFVSSGVNPYFYLRPGYQHILQGVENRDTVRVVVTVLNETKKIDDVETRIVEERESVNGKLVEVSRNYVAMCKESGSIFYFGEDVDVYRDTQVVSHSGSWLAEGNNKPGILMPGMPMLGARYYQEIARDIAMDRAEIISMSDTVVTPVATFTDVLKVLETTPYEPGSRSYKYYAPEVGLVKDGNLVLIKVGLAR